MGPFSSLFTLPTPVATMLSSLPPLREFMPPTPETYPICIKLFQYFPFFSIIQWLTSFHPAGKTSIARSYFNFPGKLGWFTMEIAGPANLLYALFTNRNQVVDLPIINKLVAALYLTHYTNRAIITPFFVAPSMSPIHLFVVTSAVVFNWFNSCCIAGWVLGYSVPVEGYVTDGSLSSSSILPTILPYVGTLVFALGMWMNIRAERMLFRLRRDEAEKRSSNSKDKPPTSKPEAEVETKGDAKYSKVYVIPPRTGLFRTILYPHYVGEWLEWIGFALVGAALYPSRSFSPSFAASYSALASPTTGAAIKSGGLQLMPWLVPAAALSERLGLPLPLPAVVFVVNAVTNMLPHARWGRRWYVRTFGEEAVGGRGAVVPFWSWM